MASQQKENRKVRRTKTKGKGVEQAVLEEEREMVGDISTTQMLQQKSSVFIEEQRRRIYDFDIPPEAIAEAVDTRFSKYVETPEGQTHVMMWLGYIDPRMVMALSHNLERKLQTHEVKLLGGPDGSEKVICQLALEFALNEAGVDSFDRLTPDQQRTCSFLPGWGFEFDWRNTGPLVHLLNLMLDADKPKNNDLSVAILGLDLKRDPFRIVGNKFLIQTEQGEEVEAIVSGRPLDVKRRTGQILFGTGNFATMEKNLRVMNIKYVPVAMHMDPWTLIRPFIKARVDAKQEIQARRVDITRAFIGRLFKGNPEAVAEGKPIVA